MNILSNPAALLIVVIAVCILAAVALAPLFTRPSSNNGLRYEHELNRKPRATRNGRQ